MTWLQTRKWRIIRTKAKELERDVVAFEQLHVQAAADYCELLDSNWTAITGIPTIAEETVGKYLRRLGAKMKNHRTGVCLCQCGHVYDV